MRIAVFMLAGWPGLPAGAAYRAHEGLSNGHWMDGMRKFTLLLKQAPWNFQRKQDKHVDRLRFIGFTIRHSAYTPCICNDLQAAVMAKARVSSG
jgi:hypothetical protein